MSANGRIVAFVTRNSLVAEDDNGANDVYAYDRETGEMTLVSRGMHGRAGNADSSQPMVSSNGYNVAFASRATNLVRGDANGVSDVFVWSRSTGATRLASVLPDGRQLRTASYLPSISSTGMYVGFESGDRGFAADDAPETFYLVRMFPRPGEPAMAMWRLAGESDLVSVHGADGPLHAPRASMPAGPSVPRPFGR
jgi:Tol biopolymer transport system component